MRYGFNSPSPPFEDNEGHEANHNCCQDGAVDGYEFVVQFIVDPLLGVAISGGAGGGRCYGAISGDFLR